MGQLKRAQRKVTQIRSAENMTCTEQLSKLERGRLINAMDSTISLPALTVGTMPAACTSAALQKASGFCFTDIIYVLFQSTLAKLQLPFLVML